MEWAMFVEWHDIFNHITVHKISHIWRFICLTIWAVAVHLWYLHTTTILNGHIIPMVIPRTKAMRAYDTVTSHATSPSQQFGLFISDTPDNIIRNQFVINMMIPHRICDNTHLWDELHNPESFYPGNHEGIDAVFGHTQPHMLIFPHRWLYRKIVRDNQYLSSIASWITNGGV